MKYWIGVASREHVKIGEAGGFCQLCHGKQRPLKRMKKGDWIIYYSSKERLGQREPCQRFTAIGEIVGDDIYQFEMAPGFIPYRRDVQFSQAKEVEIRPMLGQLSFIKDVSKWGFPFRYGHLEIPEQDFRLIAELMLTEPAEGHNE